MELTSHVISTGSLVHIVFHLGNEAKYLFEVSQIPLADLHVLLADGRTSVVGPFQDNKQLSIDTSDEDYMKLSGCDAYQRGVNVITSIQLDITEGRKLIVRAIEEMTKYKVTEAADRLRTYYRTKALPHIGQYNCDGARVMAYIFTQIPFNIHDKDEMQCYYRMLHAASPNTLNTAKTAMIMSVELGPLVDDMKTVLDTWWS